MTWRGHVTIQTLLREILRNATWLVTDVARSIQSFTVLTWDQSFLVLCFSFLFSKGLYHALLVLASSSTPDIFISWRFLVSLNSTFCADQKVQCWCGCEGIPIPYHIFSIPQLMQQETIPLLIVAQKGINFLHPVNMDLFFLRCRLFFIHIYDLMAP